MGDSAISIHWQTVSHPIGDVKQSFASPFKWHGSPLLSLKSSHNHRANDIWRQSTMSFELKTRERFRTKNNNNNKNNKKSTTWCICSACLLLLLQIYTIFSDCFCTLRHFAPRSKQPKQTKSIVYVHLQMLLFLLTSTENWTIYIYELWFAASHCSALHLRYSDFHHLHSNNNDCSLS